MKKSVWIAIIIIILALLLLYFIFGTQTQQENQQSDKTEVQEAAQYSNIQTSNDVFNQIDESINYIDS